MREDVSDRALARVGTAITSKYRLARLIGCGGMAAVYEGIHRNGHRVAIKVLHPHLAVESDLRERFSREGYAANKVHHRGAVRVIDDDVTDDGSVFLVMELLDGETLDGRLERGARAGLPLREVSELGAQLLDVLAAAHDAGVIHRDIKPENLFLTSEGVLKVLDFGIARLQAAQNPENVTRTGRMLGTPAFMAPEQALGRSQQIDGQTDVWAAGATMFSLASGRYVHEAETAQEMLVHAASRPARSLLEVLPTAPAELSTVVDRALAFEKARRWPDARTMHAALVKAHRGVFGVTLAGPRAPATPDVDPYSATAVASDEGSRPREGRRTQSDESALPPTLVETAPMPRNAPPTVQRAGSTTAGFAATSAVHTQRAHDRAARASRTTRVLAALGVTSIAAAAGLVVWHRDAADTQAAAGRPSTLTPPPSSVSEAVRQPPAGALEHLAPPPLVPIAPVAPIAAPNASSSPTDVPKDAHSSRPPSLQRARQPAPAASASKATPALTTAIAPAPQPLIPTPKPELPSAAPPPAPATAKAAPVCRAVPYFDAEGNKRFKQDCR